MAETQDNHDKDAESSVPSSLTMGELRKLEEAAEAGDLDAQKRLTKVEGLDSYDEYKKQNQQFLENIGENLKIPYEDLVKSIKAATGFRKDADLSSIAQSLGINTLEKSSFLPNKLLEGAINMGAITPPQDAFKQISEAIVDKSALQETLRGLSNEKLGLVTTTQKLAEEAFKNLSNQSEPPSLKDGFVRMPEILYTLLPSPEERIAEELAETNRVNKEILKELRRQNRSGDADEDDLHGFHAIIEILKEPFDILDTTLSHSLGMAKSKWSDLEFKRNVIASAKVKYLLYWDAGFESGPIYLGHIALRKTQDDFTEVAIERMARGERAILFIEAVSKWKAYIEFDKKVAQAVRERKPISTLRKPGKSGRPHIPDDEWAWKQVNENGRSSSEVFSEWLGKAGVKARNLVDPVRQFKRVTKPDWMTKSGQNI